MKNQEKNPAGKEQSIDDRFAQIIDMKKNENSALKKIINSLTKDKPDNNSGKTLSDSEKNNN